MEPYRQLAGCTVVEASSFIFEGSDDALRVERPPGSAHALRWILARHGGGDAPPPPELHSVVREADFWGFDRRQLLRPDDALQLAYTLCAGAPPRDTVEELPQDADRGAAGRSPVSPDVLIRAELDWELVSDGDDENDGVDANTVPPKWLRDMGMRGLALCGGAALWLAGGTPVAPSDWDFFPVTELSSGDAWGDAVQAINELCAKHGPAVVCATGAAVTVVTRVFRAQFVRQVHATVSDALATFDLDCCCVAYAGGRLMASQRGVQAICTKTNVLRPATWGSASPWRAIKYAKRGFAFSLPGLKWAKQTTVSDVVHNPAPVDVLLGAARGLWPLRAAAGYDTLDINKAYSRPSITEVIADLNRLQNQATQPYFRFKLAGDTPANVEDLCSQLPVLPTRLYDMPPHQFFDQPRRGQIMSNFTVAGRWYLDEQLMCNLCKPILRGDDVMWPMLGSPGLPLAILLRTGEVELRDDYHKQGGDYLLVKHNAAMATIDQKLRQRGGRWSPYDGAAGEVVRVSGCVCGQDFKLPLVVGLSTSVCDGPGGRFYWREWTVLGVRCRC